MNEKNRYWIYYKYIKSGRTDAGAFDTPRPLTDRDSILEAELAMQQTTNYPVRILFWKQID